MFLRAIAVLACIRLLGRGILALSATDERLRAIQQEPEQRRVFAVLVWPFIEIPLIGHVFGWW